LEYFTQINRDIIQRRLDLIEQSLPAYVLKLVTLRTSPNGVFGFKLHYGDLVDFQSAGGFRLPIFDRLRVILLERKDRLAQAISLHIASQTNEWISLPGFRMEKIAAPRYDRVAIANIVVWLERQHREWDIFLENGRHPVLRVAYEDLLDDSSQFLQGIAAFLDVPAKQLDFAPVEIRKQGDSRNHEWKRRFLNGE
jgi:LPS sulfotransferase NodH